MTQIAHRATERLRLRIRKRRGSVSCKAETTLLPSRLSVRHVLLQAFDRLDYTLTVDPRGFSQLQAFDTLTLESSNLFSRHKDSIELSAYTRKKTASRLIMEGLTLRYPSGVSFLMFTGLATPCPVGSNKQFSQSLPTTPVESKPLRFRPRDLCTNRCSEVGAQLIDWSRTLGTVSLQVNNQQLES